MSVIVWWGEAPECRNRCSEVSGAPRQMPLLGHEARRAVVYHGPWLGAIFGPPHESEGFMRIALVESLGRSGASPHQKSRPNADTQLSRPISFSRLIPARCAGHDGNHFRHGTLLRSGHGGTPAETHNLNPIRHLKNMGHIVTD
jgi:hypothetical protein